VFRLLKGGGLFLDISDGSEETEDEECLLVAEKGNVRIRGEGESLSERRLDDSDKWEQKKKKTEEESESVIDTLGAKLLTLKLLTMKGVLLDASSPRKRKPIKKSSSLLRLPSRSLRCL